MIRSKDLNQELKILEDKIKAGKAALPDVVKGLCLLVKVVRDVKSNQVTALIKEYGKEVVTRTPRPEKKEEKK